MPRHLSAVNKCPVCRSYSKNDLLTHSGGDVYQVRCCRCGDFRITGTFSAMIGGPLRQTGLTPDRIANFSSYIRENQGQLFSEADTDFVLGIRTPSVPEKAAKLMRFIAASHPYAGEQFSIQWVAAEGQLKLVDEHKADTFADDPAMVRQCQALFPYIAASWSRNAGEFLFLLNSHLQKGKHFIEEGDNSQFLRITPDGWSYIQELEVDSSETVSAFVAMWFDDEMNSLWKEGIRPAVYDAGYDPVRIDAVEHSNKIDDEIIARIRASKFVVADFTGQRGGVYFESGFAMGLGKRVIWCVRADDLKGVHFDNRQFNFLLWNDDQLSSFREALGSRIKAIFGKGPVVLDASAAVAAPRT
jgi:hypothetical protein